MRLSATYSVHIVTSMTIGPGRDRVWSHFSMGSPRSPGILSGPGSPALPTITSPLDQRGLRVERGQQGLVGAGPEARQQADLAGEGGPVVVDGVVLDEPVRDLHHVDPADFDPAPGRRDALERAAGERASRVPLDDRCGVVGHDLVDGHGEVGEGGEQLAEEGPDRVMPADLADCDEVVDIPRRPRGHDAVGVLPTDGVEGRAGHVSRSTYGSGAHSSPSRPAGPARRSPLPTIIPV